MKNIKIGIQKKGELTEESIKFLKSLGLIFQRKEKQLSSLCVNTNIEIIYLRDDDIPSLVEQGYLDYGIVGEDIIFEQNLRFTIQNKLDFGRCRIVIAVDKKSDIRSITDFNGKTIATSFPNITRAFFKKEGEEVNTISLTGSVEIGPKLELCDAISDIVVTGETLKRNGLSILNDIFYSQAVFIGEKNILDEYEILKDFVTLSGGYDIIL